MLVDLEKDRIRNRHRLDIVRDLLSVALVKVRKTRIMYQGNLSYVQLERYLKVLLDGGLLKCDHDSCYVITKRGREFLRVYDRHVQRCSRVKEEVEGTVRERQLLEATFFNGKNGVVPIASHHV